MPWSSTKTLRLEVTKTRKALGIHWRARGTAALEADDAFPVRHLFLVLHRHRIGRGFLLFTISFILYMCLQQLRNDSLFAAKTYGVFTEASVQASPEVAYDDIEDLEQLHNFTLHDFIVVVENVYSVCPKEECQLAITAISQDIHEQSLEDFVCSDFSSEKGSNVYPSQDCAGIDAIWAANPRWDTAPCCSNSTLARASLVMMIFHHIEFEVTSGVDVMPPSPPVDLDWLIFLENSEHSDSGQLSTWEEYFEKGFKRSDLLHWLSYQINYNQGEFLQLIISRKERMLGVSYVAAFQNEEVFPDRIETNILIWSANYAQTGIENALLLLFIVFNALDLIHEILDLRTFSKPPHARLVDISWFFVELPTIVLPLTSELLHYWGMIQLQQWTVWVSVIVVCMMLRFFHQGQVLHAFAHLVRTLKEAATGLFRFMTTAFIAMLIITYIHVTLFAPFTFLYKSYFEALLNVFTDFATGASFDATVIEYTTQPTGYVLYFILSNVLLYLIFSQFFIAIVVSAYDAALEVERLKAINRQLHPSFEVRPQPFHRVMADKIVFFWTNYSMNFKCFAPGIRLAEVLEMALHEVAASECELGVCRVKDLETVLRREKISETTIAAVLHHYEYKRDSARVPSEAELIDEHTAKGSDEPTTAEVMQSLALLHKNQAELATAVQQLLRGQQVEAENSQANGHVMAQLARATSSSLQMSPMKHDVASECHAAPRRANSTTPTLGGHQAGLERVKTRRRVVANGAGID